MYQNNTPYPEFLNSFNTSPSFQRLMSEKMGSEEITLTTLCQLSKEPVNIPIRHSPINYIHCLFDLNSWLEYYQQFENKVEATGFPCPGCRKYANFRDYGVDFQLYHMLEEKRLFQRRNPNFKCNDKKLLYYNSTNTYHVLYTYAEQNGKFKIIKEGRQQLAGSNPVLGITKRQVKRVDISANPQQQRISNELALTIMKLQQYTNSKIYKVSSKNSLPFDQLQKKVAQRSSDVKNAFKNSMKLISLGKQSLKNDYLFALKKINTNGIVQSLLIIYYIHYGIWQEFALTFRNQPYIQLEQALYIKGSSNNMNEIFMIGGQKQERFTQSNQVLKISFPNKPFQDANAKALIEELPSLPKDGYNFMGSNYNGNLFVFYGQVQYKNRDNQIKSELLNCQYVYRPLLRRWELMSHNLCQRFDGSFFTIVHESLDKLIIFFGGTAQEPDGLPNHRTMQQQKGQIFICKDEKFFGQGRNEFDMQFLDQDPYVRCVLAYPVFSCAYYGNYQLILSGETLKNQNQGQRQIFQFDWASGALKMNEMFSLEPPEQILTPHRRQNGHEIFSPVQDPQGAGAYGNFYVIHQYEQEPANFNDKNPKVITQLLRVNLTNGLFFIEPFTDCKTSKEFAEKAFKELEDRPNREL